MARQQEQKSTAVARRENKAALRSLLESPDTRAAMERIIPQYLTVDRMVGLAYLAMTTTPKLLECKPASVLSSIMQAAQLGLEIASPLGHAYLVPFQTKAGTLCQMIPGYRGLLFLGVESGAITKGVARLIYAGDEFTWIQGSEEKLIHVPRLDGDRSDNAVIGAYAIVWLPNGATQFEVMNRQELEKVRRSSKAATNGPWVDWFGEMCKKTVVKRLLKQVALSTRSQRLANAIEIDNRFESGAVTGVIPGFDTEESLSAAAAQATDQRAEELRERMRRQQQGREVGRVEQPAPAAEQETEQEAAEEEPWPEEAEPLGEESAPAAATSGELPF